MNETFKNDFVISEKEPSEKEKQLNEKLRSFLKEKNLFPTKESERKKQEALIGMKNLIEEFIIQTGVEQGLTREDAKKRGFMMRTSGSYRLDVHTPESDIDIIIIFPRNIKKEHCFTIFKKLLDDDELATDIVPVEKATVPVIKLEYGGVELDLLFAFLPYDYIDESIDLYGDEIVEKMKGRENRKAINGPRVAKALLDLVPNTDTFRLAYRGIKLWAQSRHVYANPVGFPAGIAWGLMLARICRLYPRANAAMIYKNFFKIFSKWQWTNNPCTLNDNYIGTTDLIRNEVWPNTMNTGWNEIMPVITPAYPRMNSTYNITDTTYKVLVDEWTRGAEIMDLIRQEKLEWDALFEPSEIYVRFKNYIEITWSAENEEDLKSWDGFLKSRVRFYFSEKERTIHEQGIFLRPDMKSYRNPDALECKFYIGVAITKPVPPTIWDSLVNSHFTFDESTKRFDNREAFPDPVFKHIKRSQIPKYVFGEEREEQSTHRTELLQINKQSKRRRWRKESIFEPLRSSRALQKKKTGVDSSIVTKTDEDAAAATTLEQPIQKKKRIDNRKNMILRDLPEEEEGVQMLF
mmetsp:Transcript_247/g.449  ORF Transcript_247/g.449 Transcript_247/m.449 type:complete len:577 (+) Transcript_247:96-1826(+)